MKVDRGIVLAGLVALGLGFLWGFVVARKEVFPFALLQSAKQALFPPAEPTAAITPAFDEGFFYPVEGQEGHDALADLDKLGYANTYGAAADEQGVTVNDAERTQPGLNLVVSSHAPEALIADMEGEVLHSWRFYFEDVPVPEGYEPPGIMGARFFRRARLLENGDLLALYERTGLIRIDKDSNLIWGLAGLYHHDLDVTPDGTIHVLTHEVHVLPRIHETRETFEDFVTRVSPDGQILGKFSLLEALERSPYASLLAKADPDRQDIFHTNTITVLDGRQAHRSPHFAEGMLLVSLWGLDTIAIVDPVAEQVVWALTGMWHRQHEPILLENGNMLLFDNMGHRGVSKVIEFEPFTQHIAWSYEGNEENDFFSLLCGSSARLSNGNTLITESLRGRAFEVTPQGDVVWRWVSPHRAVSDAGVQGVAVLMEMIRLEPDVPLDWLR